jgi:hypothetical protein
VQVDRLGTLHEVARRHYTAVEINEPAMVGRWFFFLLLVLAARSQSLLARLPDHDCLLLHGQRRRLPSRSASGGASPAPAGS